jgi:3-oxoacyl-[acyl-carrier-protein] synthase II
MERVVVTGLGVASPLGCNLDEFWSGLVEGRSGTVSLEDDRYAELGTRFGGLVKGYQESDYFDRKELRRMSRASQLAIIAATQAIEDAGLTGLDVDSAEVGVIIGSSIGGFVAADPFYRDFYLHKKSSPMTVPVSMNMGPSASVSIRWCFQGPLMNVDAACASAAHSIGSVFNLIRTGMLEIGVTGGADCAFSPGVMMAWSAMRALSERNDDPAHASRPFSADRDGMVLGEGAGVLVLEAESSARRRGRHIYAEIKGYGATSDSFHITQPTQEGPIRAMQKALKTAGLEIEDIDYINAHGTATVWNDKNETEAIKGVFGEQAYNIPVVSNKSALGHSIAASSGLEMVSSILTLRDQIVPPTINYTTLDPECDLDYVTDGARRMKVENVMSNSFAFGGSNAVLVVGKMDE